LVSVELRNISKSFGGITALKNVSLTVSGGEIHALVGENGAGKSTLMKILSGAYAKDTGQIFIDGVEAHIRTTRDSRKLGIGIIYQEFSLIPVLSVAENIFLNHIGTTGNWMRWRIMKKKAEDLISNIGFSIDPTLKITDLNVAEQQIVEIVKALSEKINILILDEPSAVLGPQEISKLFNTLKKLRKDGVAIIYISHNLSEVLTIADNITVLKDGVTAGTLKVSDSSKDDIIKLMLGRSLETMYPQRNPSIGKEILKAANIRQSGKGNGVSFTIREGEIIGIAGLVGSGRTETVRALFGADNLRHGKVFLYDREVNLKSPRIAVSKGMGMIPEDRKQHGILLSLSVRENISLTNYRQITGPLGFIKSKREHISILKLMKLLSIKVGDPGFKTNELSGGNQQKVSLAKWLNRDCRVLMVDEPTRGIDIGAKVEIYNLINELSLKGVAIIVISSDTSELMGICDRILVMREGSLSGELERTAFSEETILRLAIGVAKSAETDASEAV